MMKRMRLFHMKVSSGGRRKKQDSSMQDGVNANGDIGGDESNENVTKESATKGKSKNGILKTLRWKWRRSRRAKRGEDHSRNDPQDIEEGSLASKKLRFRQTKSSSRSVVCPVPCLAPTVPSRKVKEFAEVSEEFSDDAPSTANCNSLVPTIPEPLVNCDEKCSYVENRKSGTKSEQKQCEAGAEFLINDHTNCAVHSGATSKSTDAKDLCNTAHSSQSSAALVPSSSRLSSMNECHEPPRVGSLTQELFKLSKCGWYWGPITRSEAEEKLLEQTDGAFLVRDSSDDRYLLSLSFRSFGRTLHTRIEHCNGLFSFYAQPELEGHTSIVKLIEQSMNYSQSGVFCYSRSRSPGSPSYPVRLTKPVSRFTQVRSLQYLCRFVIRQFTRFDHIQKLPLPSRIKGYLEEGHY